MDARKAYESAAVGETKLVTCKGGGHDALARFQNEVAYLDNLEAEGRIRIGERLHESTSGHRYMDRVRFIKLN